MTNRRKTIMALSGCGIVCAALIIAISIQFNNPEPADDALINGQNTESDLKINIPETGENSASALPDQTDQPEQSIQNDPEKPDVTQEQLTDPTQTPTGEKAEGTPEPADHNNAVKPASGDEQQAGDKKDGTMYVPGFGWMKDNGGVGEGTYAEDMYENGNKVGDMD